MKYFIVTFKKDKEKKPVIDEIIGMYSQKELFEKMEDLYHEEKLFCVYTAECVLDFS